MKVAELLEALTIFASYAPGLEIKHTSDAYQLYNHEPNAFSEMTKLALNKVRKLGWCDDSDGFWYLPD